MPIEPQELRRVMGHFATGVTVITTQDKDGAPNGLTANAFMSLSLNPPLVVISVDKGATCYSCFEAKNGFTVNFLSENLSSLIASTGVYEMRLVRMRYQGVMAEVVVYSWYRSPCYGLPRL